MAYGKNRLVLLSKTILPTGEEILTSTMEGRELYQRRNEKLIARYYYYTIIKKKKSNDTLVALASEFYISTKRITTVLEENIDAIKTLRQQSPALSYFKKMWPHSNW